MKEARSTIDQASLQEVLDSEFNVGNANLTGMAQYFTPDGLAHYCRSHLPNGFPNSVIDPQCGTGNLLRQFNNFTCRCYGLDIDNRIDTPYIGRFITANCVRFFDAIDDIYPDTVWGCGVANPPFSKKWRLSDGSGGDSTQLTWQWLLKHCRAGYMIASDTTLERLGIYNHPWVYRKERRPASEFWEGVGILIGIVWWENPNHQQSTHIQVLDTRFDRIKAVLDEEKSERPPFNIWLDHKGYLKTYLSTRSEIKLSLKPADRTRLYRVNGAHPLSLTTEKETRDILASLVDGGVYTIQPEAKAAIHKALSEVNSLACPLMPVTDFETVAYADEEESLLCTNSFNDGKMTFTAGKRYALTTGSYKFTQKFERNKVHFDEQTFQSYTAKHECLLSGQDRYIQIRDDRGRATRFMDRPNGVNEFDERLLWTIFQKPVVKTIADTRPEVIEQNLAILRSCEMLAGYRYYPGQMQYLARVGAKDSALIAAETGTGKSLMAITLIAMKAPERALIIAPQGTMRSTESEEEDEDGEELMTASQWIQEINRFAPYLQIWELFSYEDYERVCSINGGTLPPGVYVSYYEAMFVNKARETAPESWNDEKLNKWAKANGVAQLPKPEDDTQGKRYWCDTIGKEKDGIRCIIAPCLSTLIGKHFDMVCLDEAHKATNLNATTTQMLIRLQPKYRYAFTATPIPNVVSNLFSLMGWLAVPGWYMGNTRNAAWPYSREELPRFDSTFLSQERDLTQEEMKRRADPHWNGKCVKPSPVIAAPARLLKLLKPTMAFIDKPSCNPGYRPPKVIDVRVPLGQAQARLYAYYLDRAHIPANHPLVRARKQVAWLRAICADPVGFRHGPQDLRVTSNLNPKVIAILELARDVLSQGEQLVIINSRIGITDTIQHRLVSSGVSVSRIDSTIQAEQHAYQANLFKQKKAQVMLMGLKCAAAHSFDQCRFEIIGSIEYSPGPFNQAKGRIDRVNSRPDVTIWCVLNKATIEEIMYDTVATKDDAATICLRGKRVPRDFKPVDGSEVLAAAVEHFDVTGAKPESECEAQWPELRKALARAVGYTA